MALNVNVNVEWWSGDDLHRAYMDVDGTVSRRDTFVTGNAAVLRNAGFDAAPANWMEKTEQIRPHFAAQGVAMP
jgi:hypothetical protein